MCIPHGSAEAFFQHVQAEADMLDRREMSQRLRLAAGLATTHRNITDADVAKAERAHQRRRLLSDWSRPTEDPVECVRRGVAMVLAKPHAIDMAKVDADARAQWDAMSPDERRRTLRVIAGVDRYGTL